MIEHKIKVSEKSQSIYSYHLEHPEISFRQMGREFGVSGQRVSTIIKTQYRKDLIQKRDQVIGYYAEKYHQPQEENRGEIFALTRPKDYYRRQKEIRNKSYMTGFAGVQHA